MALPSDPSRSLIKAEFGSSTLATVTSVGSLSAMYAEVFGAGSYSRDAFGGYGQPSLSSVSVANGSGERDIDFNFTLTTNGISSTVVIRRADDDGFTTGVTTIATLNYSTDGARTESYTMPSYNTTYYFRLYVYNAFNSHSDDWNKYPTGGTLSYSATTDPQPALTAPNITDFDLLLVSGSRYDIRVFFSIGSQVPDSYDGVAEINAGGTFATTEQNLTNISGSDYRIDLSSSNIVLSGGESVDVDLTANKSGYISQTGSGQFTAQALEPPISPSATAITNVDGDVEVSFSRDALSANADVRVRWYINGTFDSQQTLTAGETTVTKSFASNDGDSVYARLNYTSGLDTSYNQTNTVTVDAGLNAPTTLSWRDENDQFLGMVWYAQWQDSHQIDIDYQESTDGGATWSSSITVSWGTEERYQGGTKKSFRVRHNDGTDVSAWAEKIV